MKPYLIEGLDCSGKKVIAKQVATMLEGEGISTVTVIGPVCSSVLRAFDKMLVNSFYIKPGSIRDKIRKSTYAYEPLLDGILYRESQDFMIKISSHYRAWARAIVESDYFMIRKFQNHVDRHLKYSGAVLFWTDFKERIVRHRADVKEGKTNKIEDKRFFGHNKEFFELWHTELRKLMEAYIGSVVFIDTTHADIYEISSMVFNHIQECTKYARC